MTLCLLEVLALLLFHVPLFFLDYVSTLSIKMTVWDFPGGTVVKTHASTANGTGLDP